MESLFIQGTKMTPTIELDIQQSIFSIKGTSRPENTKAFYQPVFDWFETYFKNQAATVEFEICLNYFNTSTSKILLDLLEYFEEKAADQVKIIWIYENGDEEMKEAGEELLDLVDLTFELKEVDEI